MVGLPTETIDKALETAKLAAKPRRQIVIRHRSIYYPLPRTPPWKYCAPQGLLSDRKLNSYFEGTKLDLPEFTREQIVWTHRHFCFL